uniref:bL31m n=1 Tax=Polytomella magna TaxID=353565 RepID=UPI002240E37B|nr:Chain Ay, bL31m [Polytomella magna]8APN_Ay Chain Ay, bL31m [Polytomella magna]8APO_Ay Chain Ay, bL31m [Polytomella magna]
LVRPLTKAMTVVLSNGATLRLPTVYARAKPWFPVMDLHSHNVWKHKIKTDFQLESEKNITPDFSNFYNKFGK